MQSKLMSLTEAITNTFIGLLIASFMQMSICYAYDIPMTWHDNLILTFWMTVVSIVRSYVLRRVFNKGKKTRNQLIPIVVHHKYNSKYSPHMTVNSCGADENEMAYCIGVDKYNVGNNP